MNNAVSSTLWVTAVVALAALAQANPAGVNVERGANATQVAKAWFTSLMQGETAVTTSLSDVPFSFDRKMEIKTHSDLKRLYDQVVAMKGKRDLTPTSVKITSSSADSVEVVLVIKGNTEIVVAIKPGEVFRVVGFAD